MKKISLLIILLFITSAAFAQFGGPANLVKSEVYGSFDKVHAGSELKAAVKLDIDEEWHINSASPNDEFLIKTEINLSGADGFTINKINYPEAEELNFSFSDEPVSVYEGVVYIPMLIKVSENAAPGQYSLIFSTTYQACNNTSCMPPEELKDTLSIEVVNKSEAIAPVNEELFSQLDLEFTPGTEKDDSGDDSLMAKLENSPVILALLIAFIGGLALNLTPCVYPLIPITVGYFGGQSEGSTKKLFMLGVLYVLGMALTYSLIGVITSLSGAVFGALLQNPIVIVVIAAIFVALSLSMFGLYEFKMPDKWVMKAGGAKSGGAGAFFMGLTMGVVAAPCIGPFVLGLVTFVAAKGDPVYGFAMFFSLAVGLGLPYLVLAVFSGKIKSLPRAGFWMEAVKHIFGFILLGMALYFLLPLLPDSISGWILPVYAIIAGLIILFFDKKGNEIFGFRVFKIGFSILLIAVSAYFLWPTEKAGPEWEKFTLEKYEASLQNNNMMVIDFYADWCIPCKELDALTFSNADVITRMNNFESYKVDMTKAMSEQTETLRKKFNIVGVPTVLVINKQGEIVERITGFVPPEEFLKSLEKATGEQG